MIKVQFEGKEHDAVRVEVNQANEHWNQYLLDDGTIMKLKSVATDIVRLLDAYTNDGDPVYVIKSGNIVTATCPDNLKRK